MFYMGLGWWLRCFDSKMVFLFMNAHVRPTFLATRPRHTRTPAGRKMAFHFWRPFAIHFSPYICLHQKTRTHYIYQFFFKATFEMWHGCPQFVSVCFMLEICCLFLQETAKKSYIMSCFSFWVGEGGSRFVSKQSHAH